MKKSVIQMCAIAGMMGMFESFSPPEKKKARKCGLKDCQNQTTHNGGYCSAKHCKLDRERRK
jgi:hypothetical protein